MGTVEWIKVVGDKWVLAEKRKGGTCGPQPFSCFCGPSYLAYGLNSEYVAPVLESRLPVLGHDQDDRN